MTATLERSEVARLWEPGSRSQTSAARRGRVPSGSTGITTRDGSEATSDFYSQRFNGPADGSAVQTTTPREVLSKYAIRGLKEWWQVQPDRSSAFVLAWTAANFISRLLEDDRPTPQVASNGAGGVEVEWLVNGVSLTIDVASESEILIYAVDANGGELFEKEITSRWSTGDPVFVKASALLDELKSQVSSRVPVNG